VIESVRAAVPRAYAWGVAVALVSGIWGLNPAVCTVVGLAVGALVLLAAAPGSPRRLDTATAVAVLLLVGSVVWFAITSATAANPFASFVGIFGAHRGTALWVLAAVWLLGGVFGADARSLRWTLGAVAAAGGVYSAFAFAEKFRGAHRVSGDIVAGAFENSNSLGAFLAIAVLAAIVWAFVARDKVQRTIAALLAAVSFGGLIIASSRTGVLGVVAGLAIAAIVYFVPRSKGKLVSLSVGVPVGACLITAALVAASSGLFGPVMVSAVSKIGSDRDIVWRAAVSHVPQSLLLGSGLDQFSAVTKWTLGTDSLQSMFTSDPHSVVLAVLLGGGILGLALAMAAFGAVVWAGVRLHDMRTRTISLSIVAALPAALLAEALVNWIPPAAMIAVFAIVGAALGAGLSGEPAEGDAPLSRWVRPSVQAAAYVTLGGALLLAVAGAFALPQEYTVARLSASTPGYGQGMQLVAAYAAWPDPDAAVNALSSLTREVWLGNASAKDAVEQLLARSQMDVRWAGDLTTKELLALEALDKNDAKKLQRYDALAAQGRVADPASGLWYAMAAREASRVGQKDLAQQLAEVALLHYVDPSTRPLIERIAKTGVMTP
jgi:O-antigen ligase